MQIPFLKGTGYISFVIKPTAPASIHRSTDQAKGLKSRKGKARLDEVEKPSVSKRREEATRAGVVGHLRKK